MLSKKIFVGAVLLMFVVGCNDQPNKEPVVPAETRSTIEYNQNQVDTIQEITNASAAFKATGNEPFWGIEIKGDVLVFSTPDSKYPANIITASGTVTSRSIHAEFDNGTIDVEIAQEPCTDSMSGKQNSHTVKVKVNHTSEESRSYNGCGSYL